MKIKGGTCHDEHRVTYGSVEALYRITETNKNAMYQLARIKIKTLKKKVNGAVATNK